MRFPPPPDKGDQSGIAILIANAFTIGIALWQNWLIGPLLAVYWVQSVIIGLFNFWRILKLRRFSTEGFTSNGEPVPENASGKRSTAFFFLMHYGFFHLVYGIFAMAGFPFDDGIAILGVLAAAAFFVISHALSFHRNIAQDLRGRPNIGTMMFLPYLRIIPMHLTIIIGGHFANSRFALFLFLVLKSLADYLMHRAEHAIMRKSQQAPYVRED